MKKSVSFVIILILVLSVFVTGIFAQENSSGDNQNDAGDSNVDNSNNNVGDSNQQDTSSESND